MHQILSYIRRGLVWAATTPLETSRRVAIIRRLRGRDELDRLRRADAVIVSFGKSGRTWLRVMISRFYQVRHGLPEHAVISFDNFHHKASEVPRILFTHDNYLKDFTGNDKDKRDYDGRRVVLLVRDPADVAVSQYFQWKYRMRPHKKLINQYPSDDETPIFDFVMNPDCGLPKIIDFMNLWARERERFGSQLLVVRYEDMRADPGRELSRILEFLGTPGTPEEIADAVEFSSFENMKKNEAARKFWLAGRRLLPKDRKNPNSFKARRGKVGGFRDYFEPDEVKAIEEMIRNRLDPSYGYAGDRPSTPEEAADHQTGVQA